MLVLSTVPDGYRVLTVRFYGRYAGRYSTNVGRQRWYDLRITAADVRRMHGEISHIYRADIVPILRYPHLRQVRVCFELRGVRRQSPRAISHCGYALGATLTLPGFIL